MMNIPQEADPKQVSRILLSNFLAIFLITGLIFVQVISVMYDVVTKDYLAQDELLETQKVMFLDKIMSTDNSSIFKLPDIVRDAKFPMRGELYIINSTGGIEDSLSESQKGNTKSSFSATYPKAWDMIMEGQKAQFYTPSGLFTIAYINQQGIKNKDYIVVSRLAPDMLAAGAKKVLTYLTILTLTLFFISSLIGWLITRRTVKEKIRKISNLQTTKFDILTHLPEKQLVLDRMSQLILQSQRREVVFSLLIVDLKDFGLILDKFGPDVCDKILQEIANRILFCLRESDTVARIEKDEFVILLHMTNLQKDIISTIERLQKHLQRPIRVGGKALSLTARIGISCYPMDGDSAEELFGNAQMALSLAKENSKHYYFYDIINTL